MADCGKLRQIAALTGLARIADCTLDPLQCVRNLSCAGPGTASYFCVPRPRPVGSVSFCALSPM
eukprot:10277193-Alexandrium_andersonii.AAC.1